MYLNCILDFVNTSSANYILPQKGDFWETIILNICDEWFCDIPNNKIILTIFLNFKRAFEAFNRTLFLQKLNKIGFGRAVLN